MNRFFAVLLVFSGMVILLACTNTSGNAANSILPVLPDKQYTTFTLPEELNEISGIVFKDKHTVLAIEDEDGFIYTFDLDQHKIVAKTAFAGKGDYEDLAIVNKDVFVVDSKGQLYQAKNFLAGNTAPAIKIKTTLSKDNDIEGLAYDREHNRLLLAAKSKGLAEKKDREIFSYPLNTGVLDAAPAYIIRLSAIEAFFKGDALEETSKKFLKALGNKNMREVFRTSAIAIDPASKNLYVLSSMNNIIAVIDQNSTLLRVIRLKGKAFIQPEGLAFSPDGKLYVSNEGRKKTANIIRLDDAN